MSSRNAGLALIAAAALFWLSWLLMPGVGVTDSATIFDLVSRQRSSVMLSVITQLLSSALYVPALLGIAGSPSHRADSRIQWGAGLLLLGAMGSAIDAVLHLLAYAMTMPGLERPQLITVMAFMQGSGLRLIAPLIISFFAGSILLSVALTNRNIVSIASLYLNLTAVGLAVAGGIAVSRGILTGKPVGLLVLVMISMAQAWIGIELTRVHQPAAQSATS